MPSNATLFPFVLFLVAVLIGLSKGGFGGILGTLATPLLALVVPADVAIGVLLPILMVGDTFAIAFHWRGWDTRLVLLLLPGAIVGVTIGTFFITNAPTELLKIGLGVVVLLFAIYKLLEDRILRHLTYTPQDWHGLAAGTVAGFSSALAHTGGPPVTIYLLLQQVTPAVFIATSALFFGILNWIKVPYYVYAGLLDTQIILQTAWVLPVVAAAVWVGKRLSQRFDPKRFESLIVWLLLLSGLMLIFL